MLLFFNTPTAGAIGSLHLIEIIFITHSSVKVFLKHDISIGIFGFKFGLEVAQIVSLSAAVGATTSVGEIVTIILSFVAGTAPFGQS